MDRITHVAYQAQGGESRCSTRGVLQGVWVAQAGYLNAGSRSHQMATGELEELISRLQRTLRVNQFWPCWNDSSV